MTIPKLCLVLLTAAVSLSQASPVAEAEKGAVREAGLSMTEQEIIVSRHNRYRSDVSPPASNMVPLKWNDDLASKAQEWASKCTLSHDTNDQRATSDFTEVGQNIVKADHVHELNEYMDGLTEEKENYDLNSNKCSAVCHHYTQVVWATTTDIGCGRATCPKEQNGETVNFDYLVCNYGPAGNVTGALPYTSGGSCTECPSGYSGGCNANLCTAS